MTDGFYFSKIIGTQYKMYMPISLIIAALVAVVSAANEKCYDPINDFHELMGTKTAYEFVRGNDLGSFKDKKCEPLQIWVLARHGTTYPENKDIPQMLEINKFRDQIIENHSKGGAGQLCEEDKKKLTEWKLDSKIDSTTDEELAPQGLKDLKEFAERLKKAYPDLLKIDPKTFKPEHFLYKSTNRQRTSLSLESFKSGIFSLSTSSFNAITASDNDTLLMPDKNCKAWNDEYEAKDLSAQRKDFVSGSETKEMLKRVSDRLGFKETLAYDKVKAAYDMCRYEVAWNLKKDSPWCTIFRKDDFKIFEYAEDLEFYYGSGPGRNMSAQLGCNALVDMFSHFKEIEAGKEKDQPKGIFYFADSITLQTMLAAMNIGKEEKPFTSKTYAEAKDRKYHVSKLGPFATNVVAVMHRCKGDNEKITYKVSLYVAEVSQKDYEWEDLKKEYDSTVNGCNFDFCNDSKEDDPKNKPENKPGSGVINISFGIIAILIISFVTVYNS